MNEQLPKDGKLQEANELLDALMDFAYERGFHECGYNPAKVLNDAITDLRASLRREENARKVLADENERLRKDASRYRWIVSQPENAQSRALQEMWRKVTGEGRSYPTPDEWSAGFDAAMEERS